MQVASWHHFSRIRVVNSSHENTKMRILSDGYGLFSRRWLRAAVQVRIKLKVAGVPAGFNPKGERTPLPQTGLYGQGYFLARFQADTSLANGGLIIRKVQFHQGATGPFFALIEQEKRRNSVLAKSLNG
ncbi:hypothetical protein V5T82_02510 [Magnetovibrio sp. PR-2]|uniref:hypothetical protein n=1 Tax=Magnetovibrio sp. PR-2 TaxID=3120356 RepID=UPI002FCE6843